MRSPRLSVTIHGTNLRRAKMIGFGSVAFGLGLVPVLSWILVRLAYAVVVIYQGPDIVAL